MPVGTRSGGRRLLVRALAVAVAAAVGVWSAGCSAPKAGMPRPPGQSPLSPVATTLAGASPSPSGGSPSGGSPSGGSPSGGSPPGGSPSGGSPPPVLAVTATGKPNPVGSCPPTGPASCPGFPDSSISYTIDIRNISGANLPEPGDPELVLVADIPAPVARVAAHWVGAGNPACPVQPGGDQGQQVRCSQAGLPAGASVQVSVTGTVTAKPTNNMLIASFTVTVGHAGATTSRVVTVSTLVSGPTNGNGI